MTYVSYLENENAQLRTEIEQLRAENENLRRLKSLEKSLTEAIGIVQEKLVRLEAENERQRADIERLRRRLQTVKE
jgi:prefoldin subunit 5